MNHELLTELTFRGMVHMLEDQYRFKLYQLVYRHFKNTDPSYSWADYEIIIEEEGNYED